MNNTLSSFQDALVLSVCPQGTRVLEAQFVRTWLLPCPMRVRVALPSGQEETLILRLDRQPQGVEIETRLLPLLAQFGLPVATVLTGPVYDPEHPGLGAMSVVTLLSGTDLLEWSWRVPPTDYEWIERLVLDAVAQIQQVTPQMYDHALTMDLPRRTLLNELQRIEQHAGTWQNELLFMDALWQLIPHATQASTPLVFSNGDYNPANFLSDGHRLTGLVDFAAACFEDPYFGLAKYSTYAWLPFDVERLLDRFRQTQNISCADWALRQAIACLWTLRQMPYHQEREDNRAVIFQQLHQALSVLNDEANI
jgi:aminoglycoside phosphotransferase (APT) family kinase protein